MGLDRRSSMKITHFFFLSFLTFYSFPSYSQAIDCSTFWVDGFPYPGRQHETFRCLEHVTINPHTSLFFPEADLLDPATQALLVNAAEALDRSWEQYRTLGHMPNVRAVLYHSPAPGDGVDRLTYAEAQIRWHHPLEACPVIIYPSAKTFSPEGIKQLVAHELFHCYQKEHVPAQAELGANPMTLEGLWWLEGTAQFMSNWVYPRVDLEYSDTFIPFNPATPLTQQPSGYGNVHFFQSLFNQKDIRFLLNMMNEMPTGSGQSQDAALAGISDIQEIYHDFAQKMTAHNLRDSGGHIGPTPEVAVGRVPDLTTVETTQAREFNFSLGSIMPFRVKFPEKGNYRLQWVIPEGAKGSYRRVGTDGWLPLPDDFATECDADVEMEVLVTLVSSNPAVETVFLYADRVEKEDCPCEPAGRPTDSCLLGSWEVDHSSVLEFMRRMMPAEMFQIISSTGGFTVRFAADGVIEWTLQNWEVITKIKSQTRRGVQWSTAVQTTSGRTEGRYSNQGRRRMCSMQTSTAVTSTLQITDPEGRTVRKPGNPILPTPGMAFTYECSGNTLIYHEAIGAGPGGGNMQFGYRFRRQ